MKHIRTLALVIMVALVFTAWAGDEDTYRGGTVKEIEGDTIVIDYPKEPNTFKLTDKSWIRNQYKIPLSEVEDGQTVCIFGKPDKEKMNISGKQVYILKDKNDKYKWATIGPILKQDGKVFLDYENQAYEIMLKGSEIDVREDLTKDDLKVGQKVSLHGKLEGGEWTVDYLTIEGKLGEEKSAPKENTSEAKPAAEEKEKTEAKETAKPDDEVNITIKAINTGVNTE